jgi:hypothetical protein
LLSENREAKPPLSLSNRSISVTQSVETKEF